MGAFFTNVQLRTLGLEKSNLIDEVINYINHLNDVAGFAKVDNENEADKTVLVSSSDDLAWVSIYDEETEDQNSKKLNKLASGLSKQFKTTALSILVNDSDSMYVGIIVNGTLKDSISNLSKEIDFNKSKPKVWSGILVNNYSFDDIKNAWKGKSVFVEDFLTQFVKFINIDTSKLLTGYEYLNDEKTDAGIRLYFAQKDKKKVAELGLTKFSMIAGAGLIDVTGEERQDSEWIMTNQGTSSTGLYIVITGDCIEQGLLIPEIVKASYVKYKSDKQIEFVASFIETVATTGEKLFYARIEEVFIPEGVQPTYPMTPKEAKRYGKAQYDPAIKFNISFAAGKDGTADFDIDF